MTRGNLANAARLAGLVGLIFISGADGAYDSGTPPEGSELQVLRVTPQGVEVPPGRQIVVTFDRPVAPLGSAGPNVQNAPASIEPAIPCHWHWIDPRALACELDADTALAPATQYELTVAAGLRAEDGAVLSKAYHSSFTTERPVIKQYYFATWTSPGTPVIRLVFNQPVTKDSVEQYLRFKGSDGVVASPDPWESAVFYVLPLPGEKAAAVFSNGTPRAPSDDRTVSTTNDAGTKVEARRIWRVTPSAELRPDSHALLKVMPGLQGYRGPLRGTEQRTVVEFDTFPEFKFLGVRCRAPMKTILIPPMAADGPASEASSACNPFTPVSLAFTAPVTSDEISKHLKLTPDLAAGREDYDPWANTYPDTRLRAPYKKGQEYEVQLPEHLKAFQAYAVAGLADVEDEFGRKPLGPVDARFHTDHRPPRLRLSHPIAVLEKDAPTQMPLYVTNLTEVDLQYGLLTPQGSRSGLSAQQAVTPVWDIAYAVPAEIRQLLSGQSGIISGRVRQNPSPTTMNSGGYFDDDEDPPAGNDGEQNFVAEVTPFQVHVKLGHYNTLAWVTSLKTGKPVSDAQVRIYWDSYQSLTDTPQVLSEGKTNPDGIALLAGRVAMDEPPSAMAGNPPNARKLMVRVDSGKDMALLPLDDDFEIETYRASRGTIWSAAAAKNGHMHAWGMTAQGVYRLGDTVQFKLYLRNQNNRTLEEPELREGYKLEVFDPKDKTVFTEPNLRLSDFGAYAGEFRVPANGAVGWYSFRLTAANGRDSWDPMRVLVADFTSAPFHVQNTLNGNLFEPGDSVQTATQATLHAGGPYSGAETRVTARLAWKPVEVSTPAAAGFEFGNDTDEGNCRGHEPPERTIINEVEDKVDDKGNLSTQFEMPDAGIYYGSLEVESAVRDERGKFVATRSIAEYRGRDRFVGLRSTKWTMEEGKPDSVQFLVVDRDGKVIKGIPVSVDIQGKVTTAARVKGAGNAYLTSYEDSWVSRGHCDGVSADGPVDCQFTPGTPGLYSIQANIVDSKGRAHSTEQCTWVTGKGRVVWEEPDDMSLSLVPEKTSYQVGDHARYLVRNPFPGAQALVSIERFGVIKSWVQTLPGNTPTIDFTVEPDFLPGFYLSVVVVSPRVAPAPGADPLDDNGVDLGRPTYRIGYLKVPVNDPHKMLDVGVHTDRDSYKPRETVKLSLNAKPHAAADNKEPVEFAVAVLDEAVFDLIQDGRSYFDPYRGFYKLDDLDVFNYGLLTRLVGLQKFEKKGANAGGDGGGGFDMRSVSKYLAYWNPSVAADRDGQAHLEFQLPDNLTGWRVFAIAATAGDHLGLGDYKFKSSKLTELRPVMPNQLTEGDQVTAGFSVLNRGDSSRAITVSLDAKGPIDGGHQTIDKTVQLEPFKRETVWLPLKSTGPGKVSLHATARDALDRDGLAYELPVLKRSSLDTLASYGTTTADSISEPVVFPGNMMPAVGALTVTAAPTVMGNLDGAFRYLRDYPYNCWEQQLTRAMMAANYLRLHSYLSKGTEWPDADKLPQQVLDNAATFQAPNGGMSFWAPQDDRVSPYLSAATALAFNRLREAGYQVPAEVEARLQAYLDQFLRKDVAPTFYTEGMVSSVRAVALEALAERGLLKQADLQRYRPHAARMDLFGLAAYLQAAIHVRGGEEIAAETAKRILAHSDQSGGKFQFTEAWDDGYFWMLATPLRSQCAVLRAFVAYGETPAGAPLVGDVPFKLVSTITQSRGSRDHWENTQENLYCMDALSAYSGVYEQQKPAFTLNALLDSTAIGSASFADFKDKPVTLTRDNAATDAGKHANLRLDRKGDGRVYYLTRLSYSPTDSTAEEVNNGIEVHREYSVHRDGGWQLLGNPASIQRGELVRVDLYLSLPAARNFVVVDDPVPGGLEPVNRDLATASTVDADRAQFQAAGGAFYLHYGDWSEYGISLWSFYHQELRHESARFYADYLSAGHYHLSYAAQAIAPGQFSAMPTRTEEMYNPDVYGKGLPTQLIVNDQ